MLLFTIVSLGVFLLLSACWMLTRMQPIESEVTDKPDLGAGGELLVRGKNGQRDLAFGGLTFLFSDLVPHNQKQDALLSKFLSQAGYYQTHALVEYLAIRNVLLSSWLSVCMTMTAVVDFELPVSLWLVIAGTIGGLVIYSAPRVWLELTAESRQRRIESALPDALDLIGMSLLGGISLRDAIRNTSHDLAALHPDLSFELRLVHRQMDASDVQTAAAAFANRTHSDDVQSLVAMIRQTESHGTSVADSFLGFSKDLRRRARLRAESASSKSAIKLVFPLVICLAPSAYAVMITPALLKIKTFLDQELNQPTDRSNTADDSLPSGGT